MAKKLAELTIKDSFMFGAVMIDTENCRQLIEVTLNIPIERVKVDGEKSIVYHPKYRGIRLDIYARDENHTHYNVEMQVVKKPGLAKRARYYHSQMDMKILVSGAEYTELPNAFVIFICDFDPFQEKKYRYSFVRQCKETGNAMEDGTVTVFLSTCGENDREVPENLIKFLKFVKADLRESVKDYQDEFVRRLQNSIDQVKNSREMEERYMLLEELLWDERKEARAEGRAEGKAEGKAEGRAEGKAEGKAEGRAEGKAEGKAEAVLELLEDLGSVPEEVVVRISSERNLEILRKYHKLAARSGSVDEFLKEINK